ncbi:AraC family transcriptional regulator [Aquimarina algicola]|uniref:AraC family transcriptional regulator n=1 Tax=Aquimarina algicola TaxID=2589995 RepID=A0A504JG94_9FLAO|nr:AraC family transcriptional regulator [Aquimarina algicola]TPN86768.1 AraC family transcriptional regulator [Aquimarina algicola]
MITTNSIIQKEYNDRMNRVFEYIDKNLDADLSLQTVAQVAFFSPFHFHRVFKFITQETLNEYVTRQRVEKSASDLLHKNSSIQEIAIKYGFNDNSSFTRVFKKYYNVSPREFKKQNPNRFSKICQLQSKNSQEYLTYDKYICVINNLKNWIKMNAKIEVKKLPKMDVAYVSSIGCQHLESAYQKLIQWATPIDLMNEHTKMITIYHDSFKITEANKVRMSASILLHKPVDVKKEISLTTIEAGKYIVGHFEIGLDEFEKSWTGLFIWMNENGYQKADNNPFEIYHNDFKNHPEKKATVDFCIPII